MKSGAQDSGTPAIRALLVLGTSAVLLFISGCGPFHVVLACPFSVNAWRTKCRYFSATHIDVQMIRGAWRNEKAPDAGKVIVASFIAADLPTSLAFDILVDIPLKMVRGSCEPPWEEVEQIRVQGVRIERGMSRAEVREKLKRIKTYNGPSKKQDVWKVNPAIESSQRFEIHFRRGCVTGLYRYKGLSSR